MPDKQQPSQDFSAPHSSFAQIPDHQLIRRIGQGGCGEVWLARNALGTYRAVKIVYEKTFRHKRPFDREFNGVQKFEPISRLHEGLMPILQVGRNDAAGYFYCVMELADDVGAGPTIDPEKYSPRTLASNAGRHLSSPECLRIGVTIASALGFIHRRGLLHRDVKPSNIVFVNGVPKLADIGLVAEVSDAKSYVGTDGFIPPEGPGTPQADVYSLGKVLYEISTGKDRRDYPELPTQLDQTVHEKELVELNRIILKACRANPRERYDSAAEMTDDLIAVKQGGSIRSRHRTQRLRHWAKLAAFVVCAGIVAWVFAPALRGSRAHIEDTPPKSASPVEAPAGLVAWWTAEGTASDSMGTNDGILKNVVSFVPGKVGKGFSFEGVGQMRVPDNPSLRMTNAMTIEAWIRPTSVGGAVHAIASKWSAIPEHDQRGYSLQINPDGKGAFCVSPAGRARGYTNVYSASPIPANQWTHLAGTYDGKALRIYVNGAQESQLAYNLGIFPCTDDFGIGSVLGGTEPGDVSAPFASWYAGMIDEVSIYDRALSAAEILGIYRAGSEGKVFPAANGNGPPAFGLISWWKGDGDSSDQVGGNNGIAHGNFYQPGVSGRTFAFSGSNSYVSIPSTPALKFSGAFTVGAWVNYDRITGQNGDTVVMKGTDEESPADWSMTISSIRRLRPHVNVNGNWYYFDCNTVLEPGIWYHLALVYDRASIKGYVNGVLDQSFAVSGQVRTSDLDIKIGCYAFTNSPDSASSFCGRIDEVFLSGRALTAAELRAVYRSGAAQLLSSRKKD